MHNFLNILSACKSCMIGVMYKFVAFFKENKYHFIGWFMFIAYETSVVGFALGEFDDFRGYLLFYSANISLFYFHSLIVLPSGLKKYRYGVLGIGFMVFFEWFIYILICDLVIPVLRSLPKFEIESLSKLTYKDYIRTTWRFLYFIGYSWAYFLLRRFRFKNKRNAELEQNRSLEAIKTKDIEKELIQSNYAFLRTKVNPHFLFNLLNFLYDETKKNSAEAADVILALSETLQYRLGAFEKDEFVLISDEIEQIENLIYLNQLQFDNKLQIDFNYSNEVIHLEIIPLVLLTLVENMFNHRELTTTFEKKASIDLFIEEDMFYITTINSLVKERSLENAAGLNSIRERLTLAYRDFEILNHELDGENQFIVQIKIPLSSLANPVRLEKNNG